jgi:POT family proton-dependent oligopeptide transporter
VFGYLIGSHLYPALNRRGIKIPTTYKFAIGSCFGALSILWALWVESMIHHAYKQDERQISVLWQAPSYMLIGVGEIFAVSAAYEVAFTASSPETKALASATNIFCVGGIPNVLCIFLYQACQGWFRNQKGTSSIQHIEDYSTAHVANYFWVLVMVLLAGIFVNTLPSVRDFVDSLEKKAADLVKTPVLGRRVDEGTPLLRKKFGSRPVLYKLGSMRAGPSLSQKHLETHVKSKYIPKLYQAVTKQVRRQGGQASDRRNETTLSVE